MLLTANRAKERIADLSGGQNSGDEPSALKENEAELIENSIISSKGKVEQRKGLARVGDNPDTLISHWTFDASDSTDDKDDHDGTDTAITYVDGKFGKCASFNGSTSRIDVDASSEISAFGMGPFRISVWVYANSDGENDKGTIIANYLLSFGYRLWVHSQSSSTVKLTFEVGYSTTNSIVTTSTTMSTGAWHKIDALLNSDNSSDIYIDGVISSYSVDTSGSGSINDDTSFDVIIGNRNADDQCFDGKIDDLRIYDGTFTADDLELKSILGITRFNVGSTYDKVIRAKDTAIQELNTNFKTWDNITGLTSLTAGLTTNFVQAIDNAYIMNGTDNVFSIDSAFTVTEHDHTNNTKFPLCTFAEFATNNRVFASGSLTDSLRDYVWFSNSLDPTTWNQSTNVFKVRSGNGGKVTWLKMFKEFELIVYKNDSIYVLNMEGATPLTDWTLKPLSTVIGCPAGRTVCDIGNDHIYLANDGVRLLSRTAFDKLRIGVISDPISDIIESINQDAISTANGFFENGLYVLNIPVGTSTIPNRTVIWDSLAALRNGDPNSAWTTIPTGTWNLSCMTSYGFGDNIKTIVGGEARAQTLCYKVLSGNTDNGATVNQTIIGREHDFKDPFLKKIFDPTQFVAETGSDAVYNYYIDIDRNGFSSIDTSGTLSSGLVTPFTTPATTGGSEHDFSNLRTKFIGRGNNARVKITNTTYNKRPSFLEYTIHARPYAGRI